MSKIKIATTIALLAISVLTFFHSVNMVHAQTSPFSVNYNILYNISKAGTATVSYDIKLVNLTPTTYASSYSIALTSTDATNISVVSSSGVNLPFTATKGSNATSILTKFPNSVYGYGTYQEWTINFTTNQISKMQGNLMNIMIPGFQQKSLISQVNTEIEVPSSLGSINFASPQFPKIGTSGSNTTYTYDSQQSYSSRGILLILGNYQIYKFKFHYKLQNPNFFSKQSYKIVVPADYKTQSVIFSKISPQPTKTYIDSDGNYIVEYVLPPRASFTTTIQGEAKVFSTYNFFKNALSPKKYLSKNDIKIYTSSQPYWQTTNTYIKNLAASIVKGDTTTLQKAQSIENYVAGKLVYNQKAIFDPQRKRLGAIVALEEPNNAICQEYVDVFIALARADGIPSRMIAGYGDPPDINVNPLPPDILHAWVQFYTPSFGWVTADPTWQSTSGGFNFFGNIGSDHLILARYGHSSVNPPLILSFVREKNPQNNINIEAVNASFVVHPNFSLTVLNENSLISGFKNILDISIKNTGNQVLRGHDITVSSNQGVTIGKINISNNAIFPGSSEIIKIPIKTANYFSSGTKEININATFYTYHKKTVNEKINSLLTFSPLFVSGIVPWILIIIIFILSIIFVDLLFRFKNTKNKS
jgi:transglutaminase-like putative cysteine protease